MKHKSVNDAMKEIDAIRKRINKLESELKESNISEEFARVLQEYAGLLILGDIEVVSCEIETPIDERASHYGYIEPVTSGRIIMRAEFFDRRKVTR